MKRKFMNCCNNSYHSRLRQGFTLIEVVAGLAILGSVLAGVTLAHARHTRQRAEAQRRLIAVAAAHSLLTEWWQEDVDPLPQNDNGPITGLAQHTGLSWRTSQIDGPTDHPAGIVTIRLELFEKRPDESIASIVVVDLAVAEKMKEEDDQDNNDANEETPFPDGDNNTDVGPTGR